MKDPIIIDNKLKKDFWLCQVISVENLEPPFISSSLDLVSKYDGGFYRIYDLSYPKSYLVNNHIPDGVEELRYTKFQEILDLIVTVGRSCIIIKRNIKDVFCNIPVAPQHQWLLGIS